MTKAEKQCEYWTGYYCGLCYAKDAMCNIFDTTLDGEIRKAEKWMNYWSERLKDRD